jgi:dienelactone hydrolase
VGVCLVLAATVGPVGPASSAPRVGVLSPSAFTAGFAAPAATGPARLEVDPVNGRACGQLPVDPSATDPASDLLVDDPTGVETGLAASVSGGSLSGCADLSPGAAAALVDDPGSARLALGTVSGTVWSAGLAPAPALAGPFRVGTRTEVVVDPRRSTMRAQGGRVHRLPGRKLVLHWWYPALGGPDLRDHAGAEPSLEQTFPVIAFAHGFDVTPQTYARTLHAWAAAGYVVVAPEFPGSTSSGRCCATEADLTEQPRDLSMSLDVVQRHGADPSSWLGGLADLGRVAVAGQSDGGSTVVAMTLNTGYRDPRVKVAVVMAGGLLDLAHGSWRRRPTVPLLLLGGQNDEYNPQRVFARVWAAAHGPKAWVLAVHGGHLPPFVGTSRQAGVLRQLEVSWLDHWLRGADTAGSFSALANVAGLTRRLGGGL